MSLLDPLDRPTAQTSLPPAPPRPPGSAVRWVVVGLCALAGGAGLMFWWLSRAQPAPTHPAPTAATDVAVGSNRPKQQDLDLPPLDSSDTFLHDLIAALSQNPTLARLLATPGLVRGATLAVVQIGDGRTPMTPMKVLRPQARLSISGAASGRIDASNYVRWDGATSALTSVSPADAGQLYVNVKPLLTHVQKSGIRLSARLVEEALRLAGEFSADCAIRLSQNSRNCSSFIFSLPM